MSIYGEYTGTIDVLDTTTGKEYIANVDCTKVDSSEGYMLQAILTKEQIDELHLQEDQTIEFNLVENGSGDIEADVYVSLDDIITVNINITNVLEVAKI